ncbi:reverse transcriptase-like protein [Bacillaceae bacterium SIJ1]|uniref:reverse transcriptase-like protein n=1 Tax=Litoribacterium kuwaitense TaxID=1398745 RepID=UPI0013EAE215|nr:reverse transcriptase-like protein [Litoribacterium kuwaitense]NGP43767.1 reverse transcriptase-like protein [Litoribacterium kuwaitense]
MKVQIYWDYTVKGKQTIEFISGDLEAEDAMAWANEATRLNHAKNIRFVDKEGRSWSEKTLKQFLTAERNRLQNVRCWFDGNFDRSSKRSGVGICILYDHGQTTWQMRKNRYFSSLSSNNEAEFAALWMLSEELLSLPNDFSSVHIHGDSMNVIRQMAGDWPLYDEVLQRWADRIDEQLEQTKADITWSYIPSKENKRCDHLANQALNHIVVESTSRLESDMKELTDDEGSDRHKGSDKTSR